MAQKKFIAFLDILGFKELVENNSIEKLKEIYSVVLNDSYDNIIKLVKDNVRKNSSDGWPEFKLQTRIISDSIMLWNENDSFEGFSGLLLIVRSMCAMAFTHGIPLRGAIVLGELEELVIPAIDETIPDSPVLLGNGITKAFELEKKQQLMGCIISHEAKDHLNSILPQGKSIETGFKDGTRLIPYDVPLKGKTEKYYCVNWVSFRPDVYRQLDLPKIVREVFSEHNKSIDTQQVEIKIDNTVAFIEYCLNFSEENVN